MPRELTPPGHSVGATPDDPTIELTRRGARDIEHLGTSLHEHLVNTYGLLQEFGGGEALCLAGLYHAAYSTDGFAEALFDPSDRTLLADLIGIEAEHIVYHYCANDRDYGQAQASAGQPCAFRDRFTGTRMMLPEAVARNLWELTVANELEIASRNSAFRHRLHSELTQLVKAAEAYLSPAAIQRFRLVFT